MSVQITRGSILVYRVFDIAEEIDLLRVEEVLRGQERGKSRLTLARSSRNAVVMRNAPLRVHLGRIEITVCGERIEAQGHCTVWDYGVLSILFQLPIRAGTSWQELVERSATVAGEGAGGNAIDQIARERSGELVRLFGPALRRRNSTSLFEDYVIYFLEEIAGITKARELVDAVDIPALILSESREKLATPSRELILENVFQYAEGDLAVIDWNSAIVVEPSGQRDLADVLEFALTHLLEFRYYDDLLDRRLDELYEALGTRRPLIWRSLFARISREANTRFLEFSEFIERVDNSLKVVGDFYLAVIFRSAIRRFRIPDWQQTITRKMNLLARVAELLQGEINVNRGLTLELIIIILIAFEILSAVMKNIGHG